jgi:uncharacterized repeat protein (TIGR02543 family)/uncharacterized protein (TIGR02145 family)
VKIIGLNSYIVINEESIVNHEISDVTFNDEIISFNQTVIIDSSESNNVIYARGRSLPSNSNMTVYINGVTKAFSGPVTIPGSGQISYGFKTSWLVPGLTYDISIVAEEFLKDDLGYDHLKYQTSFDFKLQIRQQSSISLLNLDITQNYIIGQPLPIEWTASSSGDSIKIEISRNGGFTWENIIDSTPNNGSYTWNVTGPASSNCLIRVSSTADPSIYDISDAFFSIIETCGNNDLSVFRATASRGSMDYEGSLNVSVAVQNNGTTMESNIPVILTVTGPSYSDSTTTEILSIGPGSISSNFNISWTPGRNGWDPVTKDGAYILKTSVMNSAGCESDSKYGMVYVSESGDPPVHHAFQTKIYEIIEGQSISVNGHTFRFSSYDSSSDEVRLYVDDYRYDLELEEADLTSDLQTLFWPDFVLHSNPWKLWLVVGIPAVPSENYALSPYRLVVQQGDDAVFQDPLGYDENEVYLVKGDDERPWFVLSETPQGSYEDSGSTIRVNTSNMDVGTHRFAIMTDVPSGPSFTEYVAIGRIDVVAPQHTLTLQSSGSGAGQARITISGNSSTVALPYSVAAASGTSVQVQAIPESGSRFVNWTGNLNVTTNPATFTVSSNMAITANFTKTYSLSLANIGDGTGTLKVNNNTVSLPYTAVFDQDTVVSLQATAGGGSVFSRWIGGLSGSANPSTLTMTGNRTVSAEFLKQYTLGLSINTSEMGKVFVNGSELEHGGSLPFTSGDTAYFYAPAKSGYQFTEWSGAAAGTSPSTSVVMDGAKNVTAHFSVAVNCNYAVIPNGLFASYPSSGGEGAIQVEAADGCAWSASETADWLNITAGSSGNGSGTVSYSVAENLSTESREAIISVAGKGFLIEQYPSIQQGDLDGSGTIDLSDAIKALQVVSGAPINGMLFQEAEVNNDSRIGLAEAIYVMNNLGSVNPVCSAVSLIHCTSKTECEDKGGYWWSNNTCNGSPQDDPGTVTSAGRVWMDRNLGASEVATNVYDVAAYGDLYQWGRYTDGHEKRNSDTTTTLSDSHKPPHGNFILNPDFPHDWITTPDPNLWQGVSGVNNPCPPGFRLPTRTEWEIERASWSSNNLAGAFGSPLKLVPAGLRGYSPGTLLYVGSLGYYWSGTVDGSYSHNLYLMQDNTFIRSNRRAYGHSVRCIQDDEPASVSTVESEGQVWMDRNLGATRVAKSMTDEEAYGDLYQWGRGSDGHEKRTSGTTPTLSSSGIPGHSNFITVTDEPLDWITPQDPNLWQGVSGANNPCPAGFRLPSSTEWEIERASWGSNDTLGAFGSPLKLVTGGRRDLLGELRDVGISGGYWSSTLSSSDESHSIYLFISLGAGYGSWGRAMGYSVRCLQD